jgi:hypothetical protein
VRKDQFTSRMNRTKTRIADIDAKIGNQTTDADRRAYVRSVISRLADLSSRLQSQLNDTDRDTKREIVRAVVSPSRLVQIRVRVVLHLPTAVSE